MAENQKSVFIRFNMDDRADRELYLKLTGEAGGSTSLTAYVKRVLEEYFVLNIRIADRQEFHSQMISAVWEEMQSQVMKLVGALLAGIGSANIMVPHPERKQETVGLPDVCEKLPDELNSILDLIG